MVDGELLEALEMPDAGPSHLIWAELFCPRCDKRHVDRGEWETRPHRTHRCEHCGREWTPFAFATRGIEEDRCLLCGKERPGYRLDIQGFGYSLPICGPDHAVYFGNRLAMVGSSIPVIGLPVDNDEVSEKRRG